MVSFLIELRKNFLNLFKETLNNTPIEVEIKMK